MNNAKTSAVSGCVIWFLLICTISSCVMPVFFAVGSVSSFGDFAIKSPNHCFAIGKSRQFPPDLHPCKALGLFLLANGCITWL